MHLSLSQVIVLLKALMGKWPLCHKWTVKVQIHVVWSGHSLFVEIYYNINWFCKQTPKAQISLPIHTGWSGPALYANCIRALLRFASFVNIYIFSASTLDELVHFRVHSSFNECNGYYVLLTGCLLNIHFSLEIPKRVIGKQCRPRSDAAEGSIWSGSPLFAKSLAEIEIWLFQYIVWGSLFSLKWVK